MTTSAEFVPTVYLNDGTTTSILDGCTLILPPEEHFLDEPAAMDEVDVSFPSNKETQGQRLDLNHLVQWALDHGYPDDCLTLTFSWHRSAFEELLSCKIGDEDWRKAQRWLDETDGGLAAQMINFGVGGIEIELVSRFESKVAALEPLRRAAPSP